MYVSTYIVEAQQIEGKKIRESECKLLLMDGLANNFDLISWIVTGTFQKDIIHMKMDGLRSAHNQIHDKSIHYQTKQEKVSLSQWQFLMMCYVWGEKEYYILT